MTIVSKQNESNQELMRVGDDKAPLVIGVNSFQGRRYFDIRRHYFDAATKSTKPGVKGISLKEDEFCLLLDLLSNDGENIKGIFTSNLDADELSLRGARREKVARDGLKQQEILNEYDYNSWAGPNFFNYIQSSNSMKITLNERNSLVKKVKNNEISSEELLVAMIGGYLKSKLGLDFGKKVDPQSILDYLEVNWGSALK